MNQSRWWFQIFFAFTPTWGRFPFWLIIFKGVETTNQQWWIMTFLWFSYFHIIISSRCIHGIIGCIYIYYYRNVKRASLVLLQIPVPPGDLPQQGVATFGWLVEAFGPFSQRFQVMKLYKIHERMWLFIFVFLSKMHFFLRLATWSFWWSKIPFIRIEHRLYGRRAREMSNPTIVTGISELGKYGTRTFQFLYIWILLALIIQCLTRTNYFLHMMYFS